jgi:hypothetical protein
VVGVVWSDDNNNGSKEWLYVSSVAAMLSLVPVGGTLEVHTESDWLADEFEKLKGHADEGFSGDLSWDDVPAQWKGVLKYTLEGPEVRRLNIVRKQEQIPRRDCYFGEP